MFFVNSNYMSILVCSYGYYGNSCENRCSDNCLVTRLCHMATGRCLRGCKPGWTSTTCKQSRYFGERLDVKATIVKHFEHTCFKESTHTHHFLYLSNMSLSCPYKISFSVGLIEAKLLQAVLFHP